MKRIATHLCLLFSFAAMAGEGYWPDFRGPGGSGVATGGTTVAEWNMESGQNIKWTATLPGMGFSSPVIWGDRLFVTSAVTDKEPELKLGLYGNIESVEEDDVQRFTVICLNRKTGKTLWTKVVKEAVPAVKRHTKSSHANPTPVTDGKHLIAFFGSEGLFCLDMDGNLKWEKDLGVLDSGFFRVPEAQWGYSSSPALYDGVVYIQADTNSQNFLAAFDAGTGKELWRTPRKDVATFSTPTIYEHNGSKIMAVNGWKHMGGYDAKTGKEVWKMASTGDIPVPTPQIAHGMVYFTNAHGGPSPVYAVKLGAKGDLNSDETKKEFLSWEQPKGGSYMPTPVIVGDYLYVNNDGGILMCYDAKSGELKYQQRLGNRNAFTASPIACGNRIYCNSESGEVFVIEAGPSFKQLAVNQLDGYLMATPAIADSVLYFRTGKGIVAVGK